MSGNTQLWTRSYAKAATTSTAAGTGIQSLGKAVGGKLKPGGLKPGGKAAPVLEKKIMSVETDPNRLVSHLCGSNLMKEGDDIKLKSDEEYPEWLWNLRTGPPIPLEEMEEGSEEYWRRVRKLSLRRQNSLRHLDKYPKVY